MKFYKRVFSGIIVSSMVLSNTIVSFAVPVASSSNALISEDGEKGGLDIEVNESGGQGSSDVVLTVEGGGSGGGSNPGLGPETFSVTVPAKLPIYMDKDGNITVSTSAKIINNNDGFGVECTSIDVAVSEGWTIADYNDDFSSISSLDDKRLAFKFRGDELGTDGSVSLSLDNWNIASNESLPLNMKAKLPCQSATSETSIARVSFTLDKSSSNVTSDLDIGKEDETPSVTNKYTVNFTVPEGVTLISASSLEVEKDSVVNSPSVELYGLRNEITWQDSVTKEAIVFPLTVSSNVNIEGVLSEKVANPKNWFVASGNVLTGLSDEYLNLVDAPTDLVIPNNIGGSKITSIGANAFKEKNLLTSIVVPDTVTSIDATAFSGCSSDLKIDVSYAYIYTLSGNPWNLPSDNIIWSKLEEWDINPMTASELHNIGYILSGTNKIIQYDGNYAKEVPSEVIFPTSVNGVKIIGIEDLIDSSSYRNLRKNIKNIIIPNTYEYIGISTFSNCPNLISVTLDEGLKTINANAFYGNYNLTVIEVPSSVLDIGRNAFGGLLGKTVDTVVYKGSAVGSPWGAFQAIDDISKINDWDVDPVTAKEAEMRGISLLTNTHTIQQVLGNTQSNIVVPTSIDGVRVEQLLYEAFINNTYVETIELPSTINSIGVKSFFGCTNLKNINIPYRVRSIEKETFSGVNSDINLIIPNTITSIGLNAFKDIKEVKYSGTATGSPWGALSVVPNE